MLPCGSAPEPVWEYQPALSFRVRVCPGFEGLSVSENQHLCARLAQSLQLDRGAKSGAPDLRGS